MNARALSVTLFLIGLASGAFASAWTPSVVLRPVHPRVLFTSEDSASIAARLSVSPWSNYYSRIWSQANTSATNASQVDDLHRSTYAQSAAFVLYFGVAPNGSGRVRPLTSTEHDLLLAKAQDYLNNLLITMDSYLTNSNFHYPSQRLIQYAATYDILLGAGETASGDRIRQLADLLYSNAIAQVIGTYYVDDVVLFMNHKLIVAGALGTAAVVMPEYGGEWINYAMTKTAKVAFRDESDAQGRGGFAEGPHYLAYSFEHLMPFFVGMKHYTGDISDAYTDPCGGEDSGIIRSPWYDERWDSIYAWISSIRMPNGKIPPLDDSFRYEGLPQSAFFTARDPAFFWGGPVTGSHVDSILPYLCAGALPGPAPHAGLMALPEAGNLIFRGDTTPNAVYVHFLVEHGLANTAIHDQSDATSFLIQALGQDLALDPGYIQWEERARVNGANEHNLILVNSAGPLPGTPVDSWIENCFELPGLIYGEVRSLYSSVSVTRRAALLGGRYLLLLDNLFALSSKDYAFQIHGNGLQSSGTFATTTGGGVWTPVPSVGLQGVVDAIGGVSSRLVETAVHETAYLAWADHSVLRVHKTASSTKFAALLYPYETSDGPARVLLPGVANQAAIRFGTGGAEGLLVGRLGPEGFTYVGDSLLTYVASDGEGLYLLADSAAGTLRTFYAQGADSLRFGADVVFRATSRMNLALSWLDSQTIRGRVNGLGGTATLYYPYDRPGITGALSTSWVTDYITLTLADSVDFAINPGLAVPLSLDASSVLTPTPNPFTRSCRLEVAGAWTAIVRDVTGNVIWTSTGHGMLEWTPSPDIPPGIYWIHFETDDRSDCVRAVYLKDRQ